MLGTQQQKPSSVSLQVGLVVMVGVDGLKQGLGMHK